MAEHRYHKSYFEVGVFFRDLPPDDPHINRYETVFLYSWEHLPSGTIGSNLVVIQDKAEEGFLTLIRCWNNRLPNTWRYTARERVQ